MKSLKLYIIFLSVILIIYMVAQFNRPKAIDWTESYKSDDKGPFGTYILYNRLSDIFPNARVESFREPMYNVINDHKVTNGTYIIICKSANINEYDYEKLVKFVKAGNDLFIAADYFGDGLTKKLNLETGIEFNGLTSSLGSKFISGQLDTQKVYDIGKGAGAIYFNKFSEDTAVVLGTNFYHHANFLRYRLGKGNLFLNTNPLMFTNYSILSGKGNDYAATALSFVKNHEHLIWDQYYAAGREGEDSSTRVLLRNAALRRAFYIAFFSLIIFVLYEVKRRQRIIPIMQPLENSTLSFVSTVGQVYFERHDNLNISKKKIVYFLEHLRVEYNLKTNPLDNEFIENLSRKTGIEPDFAARLVNYINIISAQSDVSNQELIDLNKLIEQFYTNAR